MRAGGREGRRQMRQRREGGRVGGAETEEGRDGALGQGVEVSLLGLELRE